MRAVHVACSREMRIEFTVLIGKDNLRDILADMRIILKISSNKAGSEQLT